MVRRPQQLLQFKDCQRGDAHVAGAGCGLAKQDALSSACGEGWQPGPAGGGIETHLGVPKATLASDSDIGAHCHLALPSFLLLTCSEASFAERLSSCPLISDIGALPLLPTLVTAAQ